MKEKAKEKEREKHARKLSSGKCICVGIYACAYV